MVFQYLLIFIENKSELKLNYKTYIRSIKIILLYGYF